ncbi:MAG: threonine/serine exporter family protein [Cetobacterium sp.]|uniref:threonine/serine ThrE exporter family protein n=2 Tax=Cetobacterium sp. TaxID=2071632 RepID=UPI002FC7E374
MDKLNDNLTAVNENDILYLASYVGKLILESGGETYRAEDMVDKICSYYGLQSNSFAVLSSILTTIRGKERRFFTNIEKIRMRTINVEKITRLSKLVRDIDKYTFKEFLSQIQEIDEQKTNRFMYTLIGNCLAAGAFAFYFNGSYRDCIASIIGALSISMLGYYSAKLQINNFFLNLVGGMVCSLSAYICFRWGIIFNISVSVISTLMLLVPGIAFTNSIRDLIAGDLVSGIARGVEAFMIGTALAIGSGITLSIIKTLGGFL